MSGAAGPIAKETGTAVVEAGRVFGQGGTDGLILYALILATFLMFLALVFTQWINFRERKAILENKASADAELAAAQREAAEALKEVATAVASSAGSDMTFKQTAIAIIGRTEVLLARMEKRR